MATVQRSLPSFGPNQLLVIERLMGVLDAFVSIDENFGLVALLNGYVECTAREEIGSARKLHRRGLSESEWTQQSASYIDRLVKSGEYPIFTRIVMEARHPHLSRDERFRHGLQRVLDCIAAAIPPTAASPAPTHRQAREAQDGPGAGP